MMMQIFKNPDIQKALKISLPSTIAYFSLGLVFGIVFVNMGFAWYLAPVMSALVYGGSVQFLALGMMQDHSAVIAIVAAALFVALRNSFYGLSFIDRYKFSWWTKAFMMHTMVDANYAILLSQPESENKDDKAFCIALSLYLYIAWVVGTLLGAVFSGWLPNFSGLAFILPCFFMVIAIENYLANRSLWPIIFPIIATITAYWLFHQNYFLIAIISAVIFIVFIHNSKGARQ